MLVKNTNMGKCKTIGAFVGLLDQQIVVIDLGKNPTEGLSTE